MYSVYHIDAFARAGQRSHTSPAEEVIRDLISLGVTVDSLYRILHTMDARQCMETLKEYGEYYTHWSKNGYILLSLHLIIQFCNDYESTLWLE